jgi:hypothetical protein
MEVASPEAVPQIFPTAVGLPTDLVLAFTAEHPGTSIQVSIPSANAFCFPLTMSNVHWVAAMASPNTGCDLPESLLL